MRTSFSALLVYLTCSCSGCPPIPTPTPGPGPASLDAPADAPHATNPVFTSKTFDCTLVIVAMQRQAVETPAGECLKAPPADCLATLTRIYVTDTVACVARDLGAAAQVAVRTGSSDPFDVVKAKNARDWILAEGLGYR